MTIPASGIPEARARHERFRSPLVFGGADGLTIALGLIVSLSGHPHDLVRAAVAAGVAELTGMTAGQWLSDSKSGFFPALANGGGALVACVAPALPYLFLAGAVAFVTSLWLVLIAAGAIAWLRPERGIRAVATTFGVLVVAAGLCYAASLI